MYKAETGKTAAGSRVSPEALFLGGCRALAFSATSAATVFSPLKSVCAEVTGPQGVASDLGDASRVRYLRKVAMALRRATGQAGVGTQVCVIVCSAACGERGGERGVGGYCWQRVP